MLGHTPAQQNNKYKAYASAVDKALKSFESTTEWADLIAALGKLGKVWMFLIILRNEGFLYLPAFSVRDLCCFLNYCLALTSGLTTNKSENYSRPSKVSNGEQDRIRYKLLSFLYSQEGFVYLVTQAFH